MPIYRFQPDSDVYDTVELRHGDDISVVQQFGGTPISDWRPLSLKISKGEKRTEFPSFFLYAPVFTARALEALEPLIAPFIQALPLDVPKSRSQLYAINVTNMRDCLDHSRSKIMRFSSGGIIDVEEYAFKPGCLEGQHIFKLKDLPYLWVFVSEEFKRVVEENRLEGLILKQVG
jgi:hypothetical protein